MRKTALLFVALACIALACNGCAKRWIAAGKSPSSTVLDQAYIDIENGWRLRVVVPLLRSGGFIVSSENKDAQNQFDIKATSDFVGYQTDYYDVVPKAGSGITIKFRFAETVRDGRKTRAQNTPFHLVQPGAHDAAYFRLIYLTRESTADHNMVLLGVRDVADLQRVTAGILAGDSTACKSESVTCNFIPEGIAVIPEQPKTS